MVELSAMEIENEIDFVNIDFPPLLNTGSVEVWVNGEQKLNKRIKKDVESVWDLVQT